MQTAAQPLFPISKLQTHAVTVNMLELTMIFFIITVSSTITRLGQQVSSLIRTEAC